MFSMLNLPINEPTIFLFIEYNSGKNRHSFLVSDFRRKRSVMGFPEISFIRLKKCASLLSFGVFLSHRGDEFYPTASPASVEMIMCSLFFISLFSLLFRLADFYYLPLSSLILFSVLSILLLNSSIEF